MDGRKEADSPNIQVALFAPSTAGIRKTGWGKALAEKKRFRPL